jgi:hypothetical protein
MKNMKNKSLIITSIIILLMILLIESKKSDDKKPEWAKKDIRDYNDADIERLYDQWEEGDEPLEEDELPEHMREGPKLDFSNIDLSNPENLLKMSKKGKTLMSFVTVSGNPSREETDRITSLWQTSLQNSHIIAERYLISDDRAIFMFKDGSQAWDAKDFFVEQPNCEQVMIENKPYYGKYSSNKPKDEL